jgi:hypothetical protein
MPSSATTVFRASLAPKLYREIEIADTGSLYDLAEAIIGAFGFDFDHAFGFYSKVKGNIFDSPVRYELFVDVGEGEPGSLSVERTRVPEAFPAVGAAMTFLFDYGDSWQFLVKAVGRGEKAKGVKYPKLLKQVGEAPEQYPDPDEE